MSVVKKGSITHMSPTPAALSPSVWTSICGDPSSGTKHQVLLIQALRQAGINEYCDNPDQLPEFTDLAFTKEKLAIFVSGCFWHRYSYFQPHFPKSRPEYLLAKFAQNQPFADNIFRFGHLGYCTVDDIQQVLDSLKEALPRLGFKPSKVAARTS